MIPFSLEQSINILERTPSVMRAWLTDLPGDWPLTGVHPEFGEVTMRQLISTWVAHDNTHIAQIARVIGKQYIEEVGPWKK